MGRRFEYVCAQCGRSFGRHNDATKHLFNPRIHNGNGTITSLTEYIIGVIQGRYQPPAYNKAAIPGPGLSEQWQQRQPPTATASQRRQTKGQTMTFFDNLQRWANDIRNFNVVMEFWREQSLQPTNMSQLDPFVKRQYEEIQAYIRKEFQKLMQEEGRAGPKSDHGSAPFGLNLRRTSKSTDYQEILPREQAYIINAGHAASLKSRLEEIRRSGWEGEYSLYQHEDEADIPTHWVLRLKGQIRRKGWLAYLKFSEQPFRTITDDNRAAGDYQDRVEGQKKDAVLSLQARLLGMRKIRQSELFDPGWKWLDKCCSTSNHQTLETRKFFPLSKQEEKHILYFEGTKLSGRYKLAISNAEPALLQFTPLGP
jgi:hypothetical protein